MIRTSRLGERLGSHSQLGKQRALAKLVAGFLQQDLPSQQLEPHHNRLSLVYWLARRPLESAYIPLDSLQEGTAGNKLAVTEATLHTTEQFASVSGHRRLCKAALH